MTRTDQTIRRPKNAMAMTLSYLTTTRHHRPTKVARAARDLRVSRSIMVARFSKLLKEGKVERVSRGTYRATAASTPAPARAKAAVPTDARVLRTLPSGAGQIEKRLAALREERAAIDAKIATLAAALDLL